MNSSISDSANLRKRAEERLTQVGPPGTPLQDPLRLVHELQVHQIELELQNEELIAANRELEVLRKHYETLYEHAPVGYLTLSLDGVVVGANERALEMLKRDKDELFGSHFSHCFAPESADKFAVLLAASAQDGDDAQGDNLLVQRPHNVPMYIKAQCRQVDCGELQDRVVLLAIMDVSVLKFAMDDVLSRLKV